VRAKDMKKVMSREDENLEKFASELQEQVMEQIRKRYSQIVINHWQNPRNFRKIKNPDGYAKVKGPCGDTMEMFIKITGEIISDCAFQTDGCGTSIACGSITTELAKERASTRELKTISPVEILEKLGGLPEEDVHCAHLAVETLRRAITDRLNQKNRNNNEASI
jgi:nitrogen fixation NifU-like protein